MIQNSFTEDLNQFPQVNDNKWSQQDGTISHAARNSIKAISHLFPDHVISRNGGIS
jgi:hypothetical protein